MGQVAKDRVQTPEERFARGLGGARENLKRSDKFRGFGGSLSGDFSQILEYRIFGIGQAVPKSTLGINSRILSQDRLL